MHSGNSSFVYYFLIKGTLHGEINTLDAAFHRNGTYCHCIYYYY